MAADFVTAPPAEGSQATQRSPGLCLPGWMCTPGPRDPTREVRNTQIYLPERRHARHTGPQRLENTGRSEG